MKPFFQPHPSAFFPSLFFFPKPLSKMTSVLSFSDRFSRFTQKEDIRDAALSFLLGLVTLMLGAVFLSPEIVLAGSGGPALGIDSALQNIIDYLTGPVAISVGTIAMIGILVGVLVRSQRGESIGGLAAAAASLLVILNIDSMIKLISASASAGM
jgi:type IV secretory pathway VirB2 component (pilin)